MAIFSMYTSGALSNVPCSAMAMVAIAPGRLLAHSVVPSSGSTAISTLVVAVSSPTNSPMNSIGVSSRSPSPITTVPRIGSLLSSRRMASTAAWSAAISLPRPRRRAADTAARSVTRTISSDRMRSNSCGCTLIAIALLPWCRARPSRARVPPGTLYLHPQARRRQPDPIRRLSRLFDADQLRLALDHPFGLDFGERPAHRVLGGRIGDENDRHRPRRARVLAAERPRPEMPLHDRFERDALLGETGRDPGGSARLVDREHANVIAALVALHRRLLDAREPRRRAPERSRAHAPRDIGDIRHHRRGGCLAAGARAHQRDLAHGVGIDGDRVGHAHYLGDRRPLRHHGRMHALLDAVLGLHRDSQELDAVAEIVGRTKVFGRDRGDALDIDRAGIDAGAEGETGEDRQLLRGVVTLDIEG